MTENQPKSGRGKILQVIAVIAIIAVVSAGLALTLSLPKQPSTPSPHLIISKISVVSHTYTDAMLQITLGNTTTITSYDVWCNSTPFTNSVNWSFSNATSKTVDIYSNATPNNNYADFGGTYNGQSYPSMNPYHLTLHSSEGIQVTADFSIP